MFRVRALSCLAVIAASSFTFGVHQAVAEPDDPWPYVWPVNAPIIDDFRAPASPYAPGNRGLEFNTTSGQNVRAARSGLVTFAGQVGGRLFVTILHTDGVRTSYGAALFIHVSRGSTVATGQRIATAGDRLHISARIGDAYVDPSVLFGGATGRARLVMTTSLRSRPRLAARVVRQALSDTIFRRHHSGVAHTHLPLAPTHGR